MAKLSLAEWRVIQCVRAVAKYAVSGARQRRLRGGRSVWRSLPVAPGVEVDIVDVDVPANVPVGAPTDAEAFRLSTRMVERAVRERDTAAKEGRLL